MPDRHRCGGQRTDEGRPHHRLVRVGVADDVLDAVALARHEQAAEQRDNQDKDGNEGVERARRYVVLGLERVAVKGIGTFVVL